MTIPGKKKTSWTMQRDPRAGERKNFRCGRVPISERRKAFHETQPRRES